MLVWAPSPSPTCARDVRLRYIVANVAGPEPHMRAGCATALHRGECGRARAPHARGMC